MKTPVLAPGLFLAGILLQTAPRHGAEPATGTARAPDGVEIAYESTGSGAPVIVLVHGWSCDRTYWRAQIDHFSGSNRVVAVDLAGHGESGRDREEWTMAAFGADVGAVLDALELRGAVLVGHSMGGPVVLEAARLAPERVAALVAVDHLHDVDYQVDPAELEGLLASFRAGFSETAAGFVRGMFHADSDPELIERIAADMAAAPPEVALAAMKCIFEHDQAAAVRSTAVPLRLINSDLWPTDLEALRRQKPDVELAVIPRVGHFPMLEDPEEFNRLLARAVRELTAD